MKNITKHRLWVSLVIGFFAATSPQPGVWLAGCCVVGWLYRDGFVRFVRRTRTMVRRATIRGVRTHSAALLIGAGLGIVVGSTFVHHRVGLMVAVIAGTLAVGATARWGSGRSAAIGMATTGSILFLVTGWSVVLGATLIAGGVTIHVRRSRRSTGRAEVVTAATRPAGPPAVDSDHPVRPVDGADDDAFERIIERFHD